jgi:hypothetical protein
MVPITKPGEVSVSSRGPPYSPGRSLARPKSRIFTWPSWVAITFEGFRSRWVIPDSWARASPSAMATAISRQRRTGSGPRRISDSRVSPSRYSMAR